MALLDILPELAADLRHMPGGLHHPQRNPPELNICNICNINCWQLISTTCINLPGLCWLCSWFPGFPAWTPNGMIDLLVDTSANTVDLQEHSSDVSVLADFQRSIHLTLYSRRSFSLDQFREEASIFDIGVSSHRSTASILLSTCS